MSIVNSKNFSFKICEFASTGWAAELWFCCPSANTCRVREILLFIFFKRHPENQYIYQYLWAENNFMFTTFVKVYSGLILFPKKKYDWKILSHLFPTYRYIFSSMFRKNFITKEICLRLKSYSLYVYNVSLPLIYH